MNKQDRLTEATIKVLTEKENSTADYYRDELNKCKDYYKELQSQQISRSDYRFKMNIKREKEAIKGLKKAIAQEKGTYVSAATLTKLINKLSDYSNYTDSTSAIRGFHINGSGDFNIDTCLYNDSLSEEDIYYIVYFYDNDGEEKAKQVGELLKEQGFDIRIDNKSIYVSNYKK